MYASSDPDRDLKFRKPHPSGNLFYKSGGERNARTNTSYKRLNTGWKKEGLDFYSWLDCFIAEETKNKKQQWQVSRWCYNYWLNVLELNRSCGIKFTRQYTHIQYWWTLHVFTYIHSHKTTVMLSTSEYPNLVWRAELNLRFCEGERSARQTNANYGTNYLP